LLDATMRRIYRRADAYVSLHRSEGFGLCLAEAMAAGAPVVATGYSGNLEFMDDGCAFLVPAKMIPARDELSRVRRFDPSMTWGEPDEDAAVEAMRACVSSPARREAIARAGRDRVRELLAPARIGALMRARLEDPA
jgi:glycosyltransferase involved in cell wall biosynthesis